MNSTALSIVIPTFGGAGTIRRTVDSALSQADGKINIFVIIDDGCLETEQTLRDLRDPRIEIIRNDRNLGAPASRNIGLSLVKTPYVTFLDSDDFYQGDLLAPLVRAMSDQGADIGFGPSVSLRPGRGYRRLRIPDYRDQQDVFVKWLGRRINVNTASVVWRTDFVRSIGGWDEKVRRNQDGEIALRSMLLGARFALTKEGAGVWVDDRVVERITTRTDNLDSLLYIVDKFLAMQSDFVSDAVRVAACASYCLVIAHLAFSNGKDEVGAKALAKRRSLGFTDYSGDWLYVASAATRILPKRPRLLLWRMFRKSRDLAQAVRYRLGLAG